MMDVHFIDQHPGSPLLTEFGMVQMAVPRIGDEVNIEFSHSWIRGNVVRVNHVIPLGDRPYVNVYLAVGYKD